jgi:hypothetical protein
MTFDDSRQSAFFQSSKEMIRKDFYFCSSEFPTKTWLNILPDLDFLLGEGWETSTRGAGHSRQVGQN